MTADILPGQPAGTVAPAEREARWTLWVRFATEADNQQQVRAVTGQALAGLEMELPLRGEPTIQPRGLRDGIWVATAEPDPDQAAFDRARRRRHARQVCLFAVRRGCALDCPGHRRPGQVGMAAGHLVQAPR